MNEAPEASRSRAVLLVDDDVQLTRLWAMALRDAGYAVVEAATVDEARRLIAERYFAVIVIDLFFAKPGGPPSADGLRLVAERNLARLQAGKLAARTVLVSGAHLAHMHNEQLRALGATFHADVMLTKPFSIDELVTVVDRLADDTETADVGT